MKKLLLPIVLLSLAWSVHAKESKDASNQEGEEVQGRVQYALILPDEKTPEVVKAEENSPFQPSSSGTKKAEENTEENQVREILLQLPHVGGASGPSGMRVMLGGMRLVEGGMVPPVLPDQQVALRVKSITPSAIELLWIEKKATGLPPKVLTIPLDGAPKIRYRLPTNGGVSGGGGGHAPTSVMGSVRRNGVAALDFPTEAGREPPPLPPLIATPLVSSADEIKVSDRTPPPLPPLIATPLVSSADEIKVSDRTPPPLPPLIATPLVSSAEKIKVSDRIPPPLPPLIATPLVGSADKVEVRKALPSPLPPQVTAPLVASADKVEVRRATPVSLPPQDTAPVVASADEVEVRKANPAAPPPHNPMPLVVTADESEVLDTVPLPNPLPPPADVPEASVLRMLFGNHAPAGK